ncbi:MAG: hypothetical protein D6730_23210 [Bacteroidetes bacterium]|nr:MAG: hypothetical protein D6730_23210 [Bacteroidota bacterium]
MGIYPPAHGSIGPVHDLYQGIAILPEEVDAIVAARFAYANKVAVEGAFQVGLVADQLHAHQVGSAGRVVVHQAEAPFGGVHTGRGRYQVQHLGAVRAVGLKLKVSTYLEKFRIARPGGVLAEVAIGKVVEQLGLKEVATTKQDDEEAIAQHKGMVLPPKYTAYFRNTR